MMLAYISLSAQNTSAIHKVDYVVVKGVKVEYETFVEGKPIRMIHGFSIDREVKLNNIKPFEKPALIITGRQNYIVGYEDAWDYLDKFPRATFVVLDMASHNLQIEQEQVFNSLVNELFDRIEKHQ